MFGVQVLLLVEMSASVYWEFATMLRFGVSAYCEVGKMQMQ